MLSQFCLSRKGDWQLLPLIECPTVPLGMLERAAMELLTKDSQKLRGGRKKGTQKGVWHTERKVGNSWWGITVSLGKMLQSLRRAVVEGCYTPVFLLCCSFLFCCCSSESLRVSLNTVSCVLLLTSTTAAAPELVFIVWCESTNFCSCISALGRTLQSREAFLKKKNLDTGCCAIGWYSTVC